MNFIIYYDDHILPESVIEDHSKHSSVSFLVIPEYLKGIKVSMNLLMVESSEWIIEAFGLAAHAVLGEAAHDCPAEDLAIGELLEQPSLLKHIQQCVLCNLLNLIYITNDRAINTNAKNILLSFESTNSDKELRPPATAAFRRSFFVNLRIKHRTPL
jgi:hypothetical protein